MEGISKNDKQTPESTKSILEVRERQNKTNTLKFVKEDSNRFAPISKTIQRVLWVIPSSAQ